jgi:hypothetical protein
MIVARITGGLGNQLFQYAAARRLAIARGTSVKLDLAYYAADGAPADRQILLQHFNVEAVAELPDQQAASDIEVRRQRIFEFDPRVLDYPDNSCLEGYWQSEKYFADVVDTIREELTFRDPEIVKTAGERIQSIRVQGNGAPIVSLHLRRGDYLPAPDEHPVLTEQYLRDAMNKFHGDCHFVLFADTAESHDWFRQTLPDREVTHIEGEGVLAEFALMARCDHNIIANSSFSWWAAWLNQSPGRQVIAPDPGKWLGPALADWSTKDILPMDWERVAW